MKPDRLKPPLCRGCGAETYWVDGKAALCRHCQAWKDDLDRTCAEADEPGDGLTWEEQDEWR